MATNDVKQPKPTGEKVDTWEMVVVHRMFRREFRNAPGLVRGVSAGDTARSKLVGDHIEIFAKGLHEHHHGEDLLLWPKLMDRVGSLNTELVQRMEVQHEVVATGLSTVDKLLPRWRSTADRATGEELAAVLAEISVAVDEHLAEEEKEIIPLVSIYITQAEWNILGEHGKGSIPKGGKGFVVLGSILEDATPSERERFLAFVPAPVRLIYKLVGAGIYRRAKARLYG